MGDYWNKDTFLSRPSSEWRPDQAPRSYIHEELGAIIQCQPSSVKRAFAHLRERNLLASSPVRQIAQVTIACRCGDGISEGISFLMALSCPMLPAKLHGSRDLFGGRNTISLDLRHVQSYEGFKTPLPLLAELDEIHSFVDMFEKLLVSARSVRPKKSMLEEHGVELGAIGILGCAATVKFDYGSTFREFVQYALPAGMALKREDFAQFTKNAICRLAKLAIGSTQAA
jgi:hypothetical protein